MRFRHRRDREPKSRVVKSTRRPSQHGRVLAQAPTPELLDQLQSQVLVPVELAMLSRSTAEGLDAEQVLAAAVSALDAHAG